MDDPLVCRGRPEGAMHRAPVIPEDHVPLGPVVYVGEASIEGVIDEFLQDGVALRAWDADQVDQVDGREGERLPAALGVGPDERVSDRRKFWILDRSKVDELDLGLASKAHLPQIGDETEVPLQTREGLFLFRREGIVSERGVDPAGLSAA